MKYPGYLKCNIVIKWNLSFSASSNNVLIYPLSGLHVLKHLKCRFIAATILGTPANVSRKTILNNHLS